MMSNDVDQLPEFTVIRIRDHYYIVRLTFNNTYRLATITDGIGYFGFRNERDALVYLGEHK